MSSKKEEKTAKQPINAEDEVSPSPQSTKPKRKRRPPAQPWRKPPGFPKRYLSAYNLFFKQERERLLRAGVCSDSSLPDGGLEGGKDQPVLAKPTLPDPNAQKSNAARKHARSSGIGFANLARIVAKKWKNLDPELKAPFEEVAMKDKERYQREMVVWRAQQEKKKEEEAEEGDAKDGKNQWGAPLHPFSSSYSPTTTASQTPRRMDWPNPPSKLPPLQSDHQSLGFGVTGTNKKRSPHEHQYGPASHGDPMTPDRKPSAKKTPASSDISPVNLSPRRSSDPGYRRASSFDSSGKYGAFGEGYHSRWEGYERYMHSPNIPPYGIHYAYAGAERPGSPYYRVEEGYPMPVRHSSLPHPRPAYAVPHPGYEMAYPMHMPEYAYPAYYPHPNNPHLQAKYSPPHPPPPSHGKQPVVTPYAYGFHPPGPRRFQHEETLQLHASREDFKVPRNLEASYEAEDEGKKTTKQARNKESQQVQTKTGKHEDSSVIESSLEHIDTNLDTETVDFLTTLELE